MAWIQVSSGRRHRTVILAIALICGVGGVLGIRYGRDVEQQVLLPILAFASAGFLVAFAFSSKGHFLSVDAERLAWRRHDGVRAVRVEVPVAELRELHREWDRPGPSDRRRSQQVFVVTADGRRRLLPPEILANWTKLVAELRAVAPDLKVVERETAGFTSAES